VAEGLPHHITQRGNRSQKVFFSDDDCTEQGPVTPKTRKKAEAEINTYTVPGIPEFPVGTEYPIDEDITAQPLDIFLQHFSSI